MSHSALRPQTEATPISSILLLRTTYSSVSTPQPAPEPASRILAGRKSSTGKRREARIPLCGFFFPLPAVCALREAPYPGPPLRAGAA